jgi:O-antigen/teichoic acid export membrane protein
MLPMPGDERAASDAAHAARSGAAQLLSIACQLLGPIYSILAARLFGLIIFGVFQASLAVIDVLSRMGIVGGIGGQHLFIARHRAAGEADLELRALGTGIRLAVLASCVLAVMLCLFAGGIARAYHDPRLSVSLRVMAPAIFFSALTAILVAATYGAKVARMNLYVRGIAEPLFLLVASVVAWAASGSLLALAAAYVIASGSTAAVAVMTSGRVFGVARLKAALRAPRHPTYTAFALPLAFADVMTIVLQKTDFILVAGFLGPKGLGVYAAAEFLARAIANARYVFDPIAAPILSEALHARDPARLRYNLRLMTRWVISAAAPLFVTVIVLRETLLGLYGGPFLEGSASLVVLAVAQLVSASLGLTPYVLLMGGRSRLMLVNQLGAALLNLALELLLIPRMGIMGAAIAVLASITTLQVCLVVEAWMIERVHPFSWALSKPILAATVAAGAELFAQRSPFSAIARAAVCLGAGLVTYGGTLIILGLPEEENRLWVKLRARIGRTIR